MMNERRIRHERHVVLVLVFVRNDVGVARRVRRVRRFVGFVVWATLVHFGHAASAFGARAGLSANPSPPSTAVPVPAGADFGLSWGGVVLSGEPFSVVPTLAPLAAAHRTTRKEGSSCDPWPRQVLLAVSVSGWRGTYRSFRQCCAT